MANWRFRLQLITATAKLWAAMLWRALAGATLSAGLVILLGAAAVTLLGQGMLYLREGIWVNMPIEYWLTYPWVRITEDLNLYTAAKHVAPFLNPFITLGMGHLVIDPNTFMPAQGSYWETWRWFGGFAGWLAKPEDWLGVHRVVQYIVRLPITVCLSLVALLYYRVGRDHLDAMHRLVDRLGTSRARIRDWLEQPQAAGGNPHERQPGNHHQSR